MVKVVDCFVSSFVFGIGQAAESAVIYFDAFYILFERCPIHTIESTPFHVPTCGPATRAGGALPQVSLLPHDRERSPRPEHSPTPDTFPTP
jgi:hypothetical protein